MAQNHTCKFKVTATQLETIKQIARTNGYIKLAPYLRDLALNRNGFVESKIIETHANVKRILEVLQ